MLEVSDQRREEAQTVLRALEKDPPVLPYEPTLIPMLFAATREGSRASLDEISRLVEKSPKLASRVLAIANSATYAPRSPVSSLSRAISLLGFNEVRSLLVMVGAISVMEKTRLPIQFDAYSLWQHQIQTAFIAKALSLALRDPDVSTHPFSLHPDEAYAAALLHDIGLVFLAGLKPDLWLYLKTEAGPAGCSISVKERDYWGMDHGNAASVVLKAWGLPELLTEMIAHHHAPELAGKYKTQASLLCAADILAHDPPAMDAESLPENVMALMPPLRDPSLLTVLIVEACAAGGAELMARAVL